MEEGEDENKCLTGVMRALRGGPAGLTARPTRLRASRVHAHDSVVSIGIDAIEEHRL